MTQYLRPGPRRNDPRLISLPLTWVQRVKETAKLHGAALKINPEHTIAQTAARLDRSYASVTRDLQLAAALRVYPSIEKIPQYTAAIKFLKRKELLFRQNLD